ncbi:MAG: hypothetical protein HW416_3918 [Chloroflexi bacterium]|nr:hypothetical protein [Chloroflexota bacterium]
MVEAAADRLLIGATCLPRAMTLWWLLRRYGVETDLRIGVRKQGPAFQAHAWVEYGAVPLNDATNVTDRFAPFAGGILPRYN